MREANGPQRYDVTYPPHAIGGRSRRMCWKLMMYDASRPLRMSVAYTNSKEKLHAKHWYTLASKAACWLRRTHVVKGRPICGAVVVVIRGVIRGRLRTFFTKTKARRCTFRKTI